jgi:hypothetical protein
LINKFSTQTVNSAVSYRRRRRTQPAPTTEPTNNNAEGSGMGAFTRQLDK